MHGSSSNYNMNTLLHSNILESEYFRALYQLKTYHEVIDEIYRSVQHVEAWQVGTSRIPSTCFCLLLKFMLMKLTYKQMKGILETEDCPYVRAVGLLYLRYTCPPKDLWKWYEPFLEDEEEINPSADPSVSMTIGEFCVKLLTEMQYFGTTLPRIPVPIERKMKVMLLLLDEKKRRRRTNQRSQDLGLFCEGVKVRAIYGDEENEPCWYDAVIDSVDKDNVHKYWVTFPEYGNSECVDLGDMELLAEKESEKERDDHEGSKDRKHTRRSPERTRDNRDRSNSQKRNDRDKERDNGSRRRGSSRDRERSRDRDGRKKDEKSRDHGRGRDSTERMNSKRAYSRSRSRSEGRGDRNRDRRGDSRDRNGDSRSERDRVEKDKMDDRRRGSRSRSAAKDDVKEVHEESLMEKVMKLQRDASAAVGRNYGNRPVSYKGSLALKVDRYTVRKKSQSPERRRGGGGGSSRRRSRSRSPRNGNGNGSNNGNGHSNSNGKGESAMMKVEMSRDQLDRMKRLREQYGDASAR
jgi:pre-mRNA-splicing factor 38B